MKFVGNQKYVDYLGKTLVSDTQPSHAYLFVGPEHIGKHTLARAYGHALIAGRSVINFESEHNSAYSGDEFLCRAQITKEKKTASIGVDDLREHIAQLSRSPYHGNKRVLIIDNAHQLTTSAQNALLKMLEEPIATSVIILVSAQPDLLLPTVHSRCTTLAFTLPSRDDVAVLGASEEITSLGLMRPGLMMRLGSDQDFYEEYVGIIEQVRAIEGLPIHERLHLAQSLATDRAQANEFLTVLLYDLHRRARTTGNQTLFGIMEKITIAQKLLTQNVNTRLVLENLFIAL